MAKKENAKKEKEELIKAVLDAKERLQKIQEEIETFVGSILTWPIDMPEEQQKRITSAVEEVFLRAGEDIWDVRERIESIVVLNNPVALCRRVNSPNPDLMQTRAQIIFPLMPQWSDDTLKYYVAHELAHLVLFNFLVPLAASHKVAIWDEAAANTLAKSWGFPEPPAEPEEPKEKEEKIA